MRFLFFFFLCVCAHVAPYLLVLFLETARKQTKNFISIALCFHIRTQTHFCSNVALFDVWTHS